MKSKIKQNLEDIFEELKQLSKSIYEHPELGEQEVFACAKHVAMLNKYGFDVEEKFLTIPTAFQAVYDSKKPGITVALMAEYDALPGVGHACGHNMIGTISTGAGILLKQVIDEIGGKVIVLGTPAEETNGAKVVMVNAGVFKDVDVALMAHPENRHVRSGKSLAIEAIKFEFFGKPAHASSAPEEGINALDAAIGTFNNINALRQHIKSDARVHGIISNGGIAPNIVPDYASAEFYARASSKAYLQELVFKLKRCADAAALASGTTVKHINNEATFDNMITNEILSQVYCDKIFEVEGAIPEINNTSLASLDAGNVSHVCPTIHPFFDICGDRSIIAHSEQFAQATIKDYAIEKMKNVTYALALTAIEVMQDKELLKAIKKEFNNIEK